MIELDPTVYCDIFPGCHVNYSAYVSKEDFLEYTSDIVIYGAEYGCFKYITKYDLTAWATCKQIDRDREIEELKNQIIKLESDLIIIKENSIKIDEADFAYLLLRYKE